jgi:hypothetical protein
MEKASVADFVKQVRLRDQAGIRAFRGEFPRWGEFDDVRDDDQF